MKKIFSALAFILLIAVIATSCGLTVPRPEIKEGRFQYSVTYELNGEVKTISGVYVCEYAGTSWALDSGSHRDWSGYIEGGTDDDWVILGTTEDGGEIILSLNFNPDYFMGEDVAGVMGVPEPYLQVKYDFADGEGMSFVNEADVIAESYGAKILSFDYDEPIKNSFGLLK